MQPEDLAIRDFLAQAPPFDQLSDEELNEAVSSIEILYRRAGDVLLRPGDVNRHLYLVRKGAVEVRDERGHLHNRYAAGEWVGFRSLLNDGHVIMEVRVIEDALLYALPGELFLRFYEAHEAFRGFFAESGRKSLRHALDVALPSDGGLLTLSARDVAGDPLVEIAPALPIREAAARMAERDASALLVMEEGRLAGIVTDRDFCTRAVARALPPEAPASAIMTPDPVTIEADARAADALLLMARHNIRHLPVVAREGGKTRIAGLITATRLIRQQSQNPVFLVNDIARARDLDELVAFSRRLPQALVTLVDAGLPAHDITYAISTLGTAITRRVIALVEERLGPPPVPYAFIVAGSLARREQTVHTDQDNAIILSDDYDAAAHGAYFARLARDISDGLNACGHVYCPGEVMASNEKWRQPLAQWRDYFRQWILSPEPKALMHASIFFDRRFVHGDAALLETLCDEVREMARGNTIFLAHMAANALHYRPPLGFFRQFVLERSGREEPALDMKKRGVVPIIDLVRVHALAAGAPAVSTRKRLREAAAAGELSEEGMKELRDAFDFISLVRLRHQAERIRAGKEPDNFVAPEELSALERRHLKDAFDVVRTMQAALEQRYQTGRLT